MATILCLTSDLSGMLYTGVELARRLAGAGHHLTYASFDGARRTVVNHGLEFVPLPANRYDAFLEADARHDALQRLRHLKSRRATAVESLAVSTLIHTVRRVDPDLILIDGEMHEHVIAASASGVPMVLLNTFVSIWRRPGLPPPHCLVRPGVGWQGSRIGIWLLWRALRLRKRRIALSQMARRVGCDRLSLLRLLARDNGFDYRRETDASQWLIPFTYERLPVLSLHAEEFEFPHRPPVRVHYVGPMLLEERSDERTTDAVRAELETIFERRRKGDGALIYAGFGSFLSTDLDFLRRLLAAVAKRDDWSLVLSLGGRVERADLGRLPERAHAFTWLPQVEVLRHSDVALTHGGINTIDECVLCGVPMLVYCGFETDMAGNTARVVHHGIGLAGDRQRDSPRAIRQRIDRLLSEARFATEVQRLQARYATYAEDRVAERTVESLLARRKPRPPGEDSRPTSTVPTA